MEPDQLILSPADSADVRRLAQRLGKTETELLHEAVAELLRQRSAAAPAQVPQADADRAAWLRLSAETLARGYDDEEPAYSLADVKQPNPRYDGR